MLWTQSSHRDGVRRGPASHGPTIPIWPLVTYLVTGRLTARTIPIWPLVTTYLVTCCRCGEMNLSEVNDRESNFISALQFCCSSIEDIDKDPIFTTVQLYLLFLYSAPRA